MSPLLADFVHNFTHNLFKPLLLFFYVGFLIPVLKVPFEFPYVIYQGLTMYLLIAIGWHGGEELASLPISSLGEALGFMAVGIVTNFVIGIISYFALRRLTRLRRIDAATIAGYYGSDSAGTFVTCVGVLSTVGIAFQAYMPVMLAVMEIPGCLVALFLVSRLRQQGLDANGNAWDEPGYEGRVVAESMAQQNGHASTYQKIASSKRVAMAHSYAHAGFDSDDHGAATMVLDEDLASISNGGSDGDEISRRQVELETEMALEKVEGQSSQPVQNVKPTKELLHEVFLNPGIYLLFGGIAIGFISRLQGTAVTDPDDNLFLTLFQGILCLFLLEMGITASKRLPDLAKSGWRFILFALIAPNIFAAFGISVAHLYALALGVQFDLGTYVLFAVLCGAASYIAVPAVQRLAIPEASPTLPLAASLGVTFSYNVTVGIPVYILIAQFITTQFPIAV
jgi:uncharacterized protein